MKKKKADAQKEQVRKSQLMVDKQRLEYPIGKYSSGFGEVNGNMVYWITDTQTSRTYASLYDPVKNKDRFFYVTYDYMREQTK